MLRNVANVNKMKYCNSLFASVQAWQSAGQSLDMEAQCGSLMEDSWTAGGLACLKVDCLDAPTKTGSS